MRLIFLLYGASSSITYFLGYFRTIITANQQAYKLVKIDIIWNVVTFVGQALILIVTRNFIAFLITQILLNFLLNFVIMLYVKRQIPEIDYCLQKFKDNSVPYGERMIEHLKDIHTPFTLVLMDDFFLRKPVNMEEIDKVIGWMKDDPKAVVFSFQAIEDELNVPSDKYEGYNIRPIYGEYKFNFQAAIWRTDYLLHSWKRHETPWSWETIGNFRSFTTKYNFYSIVRDENTPVDYGFDNKGMGIYRGKWVLSSVEQLFKEHDIVIDYSDRGLYKLEDKNTVRTKEEVGLFKEVHLCRSVGRIRYLDWLVWRIWRKIAELFGSELEGDYTFYKRKHEYKRRLKEESRRK